jgi:hypothetical protein
MTDPGRLQVTVERHRDTVRSAGNGQSAETSSRPGRHIEGAVAVGDLLGLSDDHLHTAIS